MKNYCVYVHIAPNKKLYFGITSLKPEHRWLSNGNGYSNCTLFYRAIQKYGWDNFKHIILFENLTKEIACECEKYLIKKYKSNESAFGYNNSRGGESGSYGHKLTEEQRKKISERNKGHIVSEETRRKIGKANSLALKGRVVPQEVRDKISAHNARGFLGKHHTEETKRKNSEAHKGKQYHLGHKHSDETKQKMRLAKLGKKRGSWTNDERKAHMEAIERRRKEKLQNTNT